MYNRLLALFDEDLARYTIVVFTGGDSIKPGQTVDNLLAKAPESMKRVLRACENRYVVFNNKDPNKHSQVDLLLQQVRKLVAKNGGVPYTCPKFFHVGEEMEKEVKNRMAKVEKKYLQSKQYVQQLQVKTNQAKIAVEREKEESEKKEKARQKEMEELKKKSRAQVESLKQELEEQQMSEEKRQQETEALRKKLEEDSRRKMRKKTRARKSQEKRRRDEQNDGKKVGRGKETSRSTG